MLIEYNHCLKSSTIVSTRLQINNIQTKKLDVITRDTTLQKIYTVPHLQNKDEWDENTI